MTDNERNAWIEIDGRYEPNTCYNAGVYGPAEPHPDASAAAWNQHAAAVRGWVAASALAYGSSVAKPLAFREVFNPVAYSESLACPF